MEINKYKISILYLGSASGTCLDRANALRRLGHNVNHIDPRELLPKTLWVDRATWHFGGGIFNYWIVSKLVRILAASRAVYDLCYIDGGEWATPAVIRQLRNYAYKIVNYNIDDPLGERDRRRSSVYRSSLRHYDLCIVMRPQNIIEAKERGAANVMRVFRSADEVSHAPRILTLQDHKQWDAEVLFLGTWMPERGEFMMDLIKLGVPLTIQGSRWQKSPQWKSLKPYWRGDALQGDDYAKAIQCAKVNIGLLSKGNRDLHTTRSLEIPALGGLFCAERTSEHLNMYHEGTEALFWDDAKECATICKKILADECTRKSIAIAGQNRIKKNGHYNEMILQEIIASVYPKRSDGHKHLEVDPAGHNLLARE